MRKLIVAAFLLAFAAPAIAQPAPVGKIHLGANAVWYDDEVRPSDVELGGTASASLQPHIALVGSAFYGLEKSYLIGQAGVRITATDVENKDFSIGVGFQYRASSKVGARPEGWGPDVSIGWRPWPYDLPLVTIGVQGGYGMTENEAYALAAVRYQIGGFGR